jgi:hypothetical protein
MINLNLEKICQFIALDEPLLIEVFENKKYKIRKFLGFNFMIPNPEILLGCKINAVMNRSKEDKKQIFILSFGILELNLIH